MSGPVGRFNLRSRKSLKLTGAVECSSCKRHYFPIDIADDGDRSEKICCDCEAKRQTTPEPKRRAVKRKRFTAPTLMKVEDDQCQSISTKQIERKNYSTRSSNLTKDAMVEIHFRNASSTIPNDNKHVNSKQVKLDDVQRDAKVEDSFKAHSNVVHKGVKGDPFSSTVKPTNDRMITKNDTADTLRHKFPDVNSFEFEFLLFLKDS